MRSIRLLLTAGVASFLFFLVALLPARLLISQLVGQDGRYGGVNGTLWNGSVAFVEIQGFQLRNTAWSINPFALLIGRLSSQLATSVSGGELTTDASMSLFGNIGIRNLIAAGPVEPIAKIMRLPAVAGRYKVDVPELAIASGWVEKIVGEVSVSNLPLNMLGLPGGPAGSYRLEFDVPEVQDDGRIVGLISDQGGSLEVGGELVLTPPTNYELRAGVKARADAPPELAQGLTLIGPEDASGRREVILTGSF